MSLKDPIIIPQAPPIGTVIRPIRITPEDSDPQVGKSMLGNPVYSNLIFNADPDTPENADIVIDDILMEVYQPKNIVKTRVAGRNGTVKEYISLGDYEITCRGAVVTPQRNVSPVDTISALKNLFELKKSIEVSGNFLQLFEITNVVIEEYTFSEIQGSRNFVPFYFRMVSDDPIEIKVNA